MKKKDNFYTCPFCGKEAFYFVKPLKLGEMIRASNVVFDDKTHPATGSDIKCQHCKRCIYGRFG